MLKITKVKMKFAVFGALVCAVVSADMRSTVYDAIVSRSGHGDCKTFSSMFSPKGTYASPVGSDVAVGPTAIEAACEEWNDMLGEQGNGWYPGDLWNAPNRTAFSLRIRAVSAGGCTVNVEGIVQMDYDTESGLIDRWDHFYDGDWVGPQLAGCKN